VSISQFQEHEFFSVFLVIRISYISNISALHSVVTTHPHLTQRMKGQEFHFSSVLFFLIFQWRIVFLKFIKFIESCHCFDYSPQSHQGVMWSEFQLSRIQYNIFSLNFLWLIEFFIFQTHQLQLLLRQLKNPIHPRGWRVRNFTFSRTWPFFSEFFWRILFFIFQNISTLACCKNSPHSL